jgi:glycosyltransferase involved in cell wall biosynthesis
MTISSKTCFLFTYSYPYGESEVFIEQEMPFLARYFKKVVVFPMENKGELRILPPNVEVRFLFAKMKEDFNPQKVLQQNLVLFSKIMLGEFLIHPILTLKNIKRLSSSLLQQFYRANLLKNQLENTTDIVLYSYWFDNWVLLLTLLKLELKINSRAHGFDVFKNQTLKNYHPFKNRMFSKVEGVYSISKMGANYLRNHYPDFKSKIHFQYLGVKEAGTNPIAKNNSLHIVSCAHVREIKRLHLAVDILKEIKIPVKWTLIGNGEDLVKIKSFSEELPSHIQSEFKGHQTLEQIMEFHATVPVSLFMSLSRSEGLPFTMIEAISFGIPILSTDVGGCNEIVTDKTGILIPMNFDPVKVAQQIEEFAQSNMNTEDFRRGVKAFWKENFEAEKNYFEFYRNISIG